MSKCSYCGEDIGTLPFKCRHCGKNFCVHHRLSDNHECSNELVIEKIRDSVQKKTMVREKSSESGGLVEELNRELKLLVNSGITSEEELNEGYYMVLDEYQLYPDRSFSEQSIYLLNYRELTRYLANNTEYEPFVLGKNHVIALYLYQKEIPESIKLLKELKIVVIDNANLNEFPKELALLSNLRYLYIKKSNLTEIPNLAAMFPKLRFLGLSGVKLQSSPDWLFEFASRHHSRQYIRKGLGDMNQLALLEIEWIETATYSQGVDKEDAAVLGFLEILTGKHIENDQPDERITNQHNLFRDTIWPKLQQDIIEFENSSSFEIIKGRFPEGKLEEMMEQMQKIFPGELPKKTINVPWDYNDYEAAHFRYTVNKLGKVIGLDIGYMSEGGTLLLPYFPEEISKLQHLQVLRIGVAYRSEEEWVVDSLIPESIRDLKSLRYFWTNAKYSESLKPFLESLEKFGKLF